MKARGYLMYAVFVAAACGAIAIVVSHGRNAQATEDANKYPPPQVVRIPNATPPPGGQPLPPGGNPPFAGPLQPGVGPLRGGPPMRGAGPLPFRADGDARPPFVGGVKQEPVVDLNSAPVSALVTLPGITPEYARKIVEHRPYKDRPDLETRTGLPHDVVEKLGPPAMIRSTSIEPLPLPKKGK